MSKSNRESAPAPAQVRDLSSAHHVGEHWIRERLWSAAILLLGVWLLASLLMLPGLDRRTLSEWLRGASGAVPMALFIVAAFKHGADGLKVAVDDYVHDDGNRFLINGLILFLAVGGASLALFALAKIAFSGAA
jgi:succinate dehydrogenase / fumarate reductase membrane anchor subunit